VVWILTHHWICIRCSGKTLTGGSAFEELLYALACTHSGSQALSTPLFIYIQTFLLLPNFATQFTITHL